MKEPNKISIKEGETVVYNGKTKVRFSNLRGVIYSHLADSKNHSMCAVAIEAGDTKKDMTFERESPGDLQYQAFVDLEIALEGVDPYHQPSSAWFLVKEK